MTWLGQKTETEPTRPIPTATVVSPQAAPQPAPAAERVEKVEQPRVASIGKSLHIKGELSGNEDLAIEGKVEGKISLNGYNVKIGETGRVSAEIHAKTVVVGGLVNGDIKSNERVEVAATGTMVGDICAPRVVLVDGSRFKGNIDMDTESTSRNRTPEYAGAAKS
jgi:cytoskeletal protein CcmA (bactofilin family)